MSKYASRSTNTHETILNHSSGAGNVCVWETAFDARNNALKPGCMWRIPIAQFCIVPMPGDDRRSNNSHERQIVHTNTTKHLWIVQQQTMTPRRPLFQCLIQAFYLSIGSPFINIVYAGEWLPFHSLLSLHPRSALMMSNDCKQHRKTERRKTERTETTERFHTIWMEQNISLLSTSLYLHSRPLF